MAISKNKRMYLVLNAKTMGGANKVIGGSHKLSEAKTLLDNDKGGRCIVEADLGEVIDLCPICGTRLKSNLRRDKDGK